MIHLLLSFLFPSSCLSCKRPDTALCAPCLRTARKALSSPSPFIISIFDYKDPLIKRSIHGMKFFGRKDIAVSLASELADLVLSIPDCQSYVLVPVPMSTMRKYFRGYNQSEVLAQHVSLYTSIPMDSSLLVRHSSPKRQVDVKSRYRRLLNQKGTFACGDVRGKHLLLIDDVTTTGATLQEARTVLLKGGAAEVRAITIAH